MGTTRNTWRRLNAVRRRHREWSLLPNEGEACQYHYAGLIYQGDAYGADGLRGYDAAVKTYHLHSVGVTDYQDTDTTFTAEAQDMKSLGAKTVVLTSTPTATGGIIGAAAALGYFPTYLIQGPGWVEQLMTANGAVGGTPTPLAPILTKYAYVLSFAAPWNSPSASGMKAMIAAQKKYFPSEIPSVYFSTGYEETMIAAKISRRRSRTRTCHEPDREGASDDRADQDSGDDAGPGLHTSARTSGCEVRHQHGQRDRSWLPPSVRSGLQGPDSGEGAVNNHSTSVEWSAAVPGPLRPGTAAAGSGDHDETNRHNVLRSSPWPHRA